MTIFEYIKTKATKEEIAKMFTFLDNASVLLMLGKLDNWYSTNYEDDKMYNLNKEIGDK